MSQSAAILSVCVSVASLVTGGIVVWVFARPGVRRVRAAAEAILGEEATEDRAGNVIIPARPGLVHRVGSVEQTLALLVSTNDRLDNHERRLTALEAATLERIMTKAEAAAAWQAIVNRDTIDGEAESSS